MADVETLATFDDFKSHFGDNPMRGGSFFGGPNFIALPQGGLRIREGTVALDSTGLANTTSFFMSPISGGDAMVSTGTATWRISTSAPAGLTAFASSSIGNSSGWCYYRTGSLVTITGDKTYRVGVLGLSALAGSVGGAHVGVLGDRIYVANISGNGNRIRYSDAASETSWTATNFIDIGTDEDTIVLMRSQRDSLVVATLSGSGGAQWWRVSGTPGVNQTVVRTAPRTAYVHGGDHRPYSCDGYGSRIWFSVVGLDGYGGWYGWLDADTPKTSNDPRPLNTTSTSQLLLGANPYTIGSLTTAPLTLMVSGTFSTTTRSRALLFDSGTCVGQMVFDWPGTIDANSEFQVIGDASGTKFVLGNGGTAGARPRFQEWGVVQPLDVAPDETDGSGAVVTGEVHTPIISDPQNRQIQVQAVAVDYRHYSSTTAMSCTVEATGVYELPFQVSATQAFTVSGAPGTVGQRARHTFYVGDSGVGNAAQVKLTACRGIAIERIRVLGVVSPSYV